MVLLNFTCGGWVTALVEVAGRSALRFEANQQLLSIVQQYL